MVAYLGLAACAILAYVIAWREGVLRNNRRIFLSAFLIACAMALRALCMEHETLDYQDFLHHWMEYFRSRGGVRALGENVGNYNVPYLYFLALFSYSGIRDLYLIKLLSVVFDVLLAWGALRLARKVSQSDGAALAAFLITLLLPTVVLNGAYWGQCDSIYTAFGVWSLAYALERKPVRAMAALALSFAFKLQAVFLIPVFLVLIYAGRVRWRDLPVFPLTYLAVVLPAVALGRPLADTVLLYYNQMDTVGSALNYNSSSVYAFVSGTQTDPETLARAGVIAAFAFLLIIYVLCSIFRERLNDRTLLVCAVLISVGVPFLLPHMHDRYFFPADVLSLILAVCVPALAPAAAAVSFASLLGYHAYLRMRFLLPMRYGAFALLGVIAVLTLMLTGELLPQEKPEPARSAAGRSAAGRPAARGNAARSRAAGGQAAGALPGGAARKRARRQERDFALQSSRTQARRRARQRSRMTLEQFFPGLRRDGR